MVWLIEYLELYPLRALFVSQKFRITKSLAVMSFPKTSIQERPKSIQQHYPWMLLEAQEDRYTELVSLLRKPFLSLFSTVTMNLGCFLFQNCNKEYLKKEI